MNDEDEPKAPTRMSDLLGKFKLPKKEEKKKGIYTPQQDFAVELATFYNEPKKVGFWLGVIKRFGMETVRVQWKGMADSRAPNSAGLLLFMLKKKRDQYAQKGNANNATGEIQGTKDQSTSK